MGIARKPRPTAAGLSHVSARSQRADGDDSDFLRFESELARVHEGGACRCVAACVLTTHYHLLLDVADGALSASIGLLNRRYASAYNRRYGRRGHAFSERFLAVTVDSNEHLLTVYRYIARNPVEAGLCTSPQSWPWSSYAALTGNANRFAFADASIVVGACDGLAALRRFVESDA